MDMVTDTVPATPSLALYRTAHKIEPLNVAGRQVCAKDRIGVYRVLSQRWNHDQDEIRKLMQLESRALVYEPCFFCGSVDMIADGLYSAVTLGTGVVNLCDNCRAKGEEDDEEPEFDREGQPEFNGAFR